MPYRSDVDGLRAVSVILVLLFHLGVGEVPGGFIGVDVFFVISGYLITGIILQALEAGEFSLIWFYERRVRRILPALVAVIAAALLAGLALLTPGAYRDLSLSALSTIAAVPNVYFRLNTGYFATAAELTPLLHMWSLGVEEQFYFVWPALLFWVCRARRDLNRLLVTVVGIVAISFAISVWLTFTSPKTAFYLPHSRAWELGSGAVLAILERRGRYVWRAWIAESMSLAGICLILFGAAILAKTDRFPGLNALFPVVGACFVIMSGRQGTLVARCLSLRPIVQLGKISYSLYLWHWPMIVFWREYSNSVVLETPAKFVIGFASVMLAWVSWRWIEQPFRSRSIGRRAVFACAGIAVTIVVGGATTVALLNGLPGRLPETAHGVMNEDDMWKWKCPYNHELGISRFDRPGETIPSCVVGTAWETSKSHLLIWGDSNAEHFLPLLDRAGRNMNAAIGVVTPCPAIVRHGGVERAWPDIPDYSRRCGIQRASVLAMLRTHPEIGTILIASRWSDHAPFFRSTGARTGTQQSAQLNLLRQGLEELLSDLPSDRIVVVMGETPKIRGANRIACRITELGTLWRRPCTVDVDLLAYKEFMGPGRLFKGVIDQVTGLHPNARAFHPQVSLCGEGRCTTKINGEFIYRDGIHFRRNLNPSIEEKLITLLRLDDLLRGARK